MTTIIKPSHLELVERSSLYGAEVAWLPPDATDEAKLVRAGSWSGLHALLGKLTPEKHPPAPPDFSGGGYRKNPLPFYLAFQYLVCIFALPSLFIIDIPFFEQKELSKEILSNLETKDIKDKKDIKYKELMKIPEEERALFRKNGVSIDGQKNILAQLKIDIKSKRNLITWTRYPKYEELQYLFKLAWNNLLRPGESVAPVISPSNLTRITFNVYRYDNSRSIYWLVDDMYKSNIGDRDFYIEQKDRINDSLEELSKDEKASYKKNSEYKKYKRGQKLKDMDDASIYNESVTNSFQIYRHWFQYKVPKWIRVVNELQKYLCEKEDIRPGSYSHYASNIENDSISDNLAILLEYSIPSSAIKKLENYISSDFSQDKVLGEIKKRKLYEKDIFIEYERQKLKENL